MQSKIALITLLLCSSSVLSPPVLQQMATTLVSHYLQMSLAVATKVVQELHPYWVSKRNKVHKPLCRKYWPATAPNDTNPHLVFR